VAAWWQLHWPVSEAVRRTACRPGVVAVKTVFPDGSIRVECP
jgi:hypothetical protein